jgi:hypothetical protein
MALRDQLKSGAARPVHHRGPSDHRVVILAGVLISLVTIGVVLYVKGQSQAYRTDPDTLCRTDGPPSQVVVILLDMSDQFTEAQLLGIGNQIDRLLSGLPRFALLEAYTVAPSEQGMVRPMLHLCNPGSGDDLSPIYQNPDLAKQRWRAFLSKLRDQLGLLMKEPESQTSPIFEAVQAVALRTFGQSKYDGLPKRLIIVSDLLQNVPGKMVQYQAAPSFDEFRRTPYFAEIRANLSQVVVTVLYLVRPRPQKWPDHYRFWEQYFAAEGASVDAIDPIYGAR